MARSVRSKRRLRNQRVQAEKLKVFENKRLDEIIKKREEHFDNQIVDAQALNIPPELAALNNKSNDNAMELEKPKEKEIKKNNKKQDEMVDDDDDDEEDSDEEMGDSTKVKKSVTPAHLSHKETKQKYVKLYIKKQKKRSQQKKKVPIV